MAETLQFDPGDPKGEKTGLELLERAKKLLDWSEEIPDNRISGRDPEFRKYKVRNAWFSNVLAYANLAIDAVLLSETTRNCYVEALKKFSNKEFRIRNHTRDDIDEMNQFLVQVINELEGRQDGRV